MYRFHSISFPSEWERSLLGGGQSLRYKRFHSISFPSEWESERSTVWTIHNAASVSIQLVFPASGKDVSLQQNDIIINCFHSISFPSEWERLDADEFPTGDNVFPFN